MAKSRHFWLGLARWWHGPMCTRCGGASPYRSFSAPCCDCRIAERDYSAKLYDEHISSRLDELLAAAKRLTISQPST